MVKYYKIKNYPSCVRLILIDDKGETILVKEFYTDYRWFQHEIFNEIIELSNKFKFKITKKLTLEIAKNIKWYF